MTVRPAVEADLDAVSALGAAEELAWFGEAGYSADEVREWLDSEGGVVRGVVAVDDDGAARGFAAVGRREAIFLAEPDRVEAVGDLLLPWLSRQQRGGDLMTFAGDSARVRTFERHGLRHLRSSFTLVRRDSAGMLPRAVVPKGVDVVPYRLGDADEAVHRLIYVDASWASVPGHSERDLEAWREMMRPCRSLFLARRNGRPVGWVAGRLLDSGRGCVTSLAVAATERRRGLGRALLLHAFADLQQAGAHDLTLDVQAENDTALVLYRSVGLEVEQEWRIYTGSAG